MNGAAVLIFAFSRDVHWLDAAVLGIAAIVGGLAGAWMLRWVNEKALKIGVVILGLVLTVGLFLRGGG